MTTDGQVEEQALEAQAPSDSKGPARPKPTKPLPTDRVSMDKQLFILRAIAKASLSVDKQSVSNADVARIADIHPSSVSVCNPFWNDIGLLTREGQKQLPHAAVFEYDQAAEWNPEKAGIKLARVMEATWFARAVLPRLALRTMSRVEVIENLAEECRAPIEFKSQIELLLDYLKCAGLVTVDGTNVMRGAPSIETPALPKQPIPPPADQVHQGSLGASHGRSAMGTKRISIALPDKDNVNIELPEGFDLEDWILVSEHLAGYLRRWKKFQSQKGLKDAIDEASSAEGEA